VPWEVKNILQKSPIQCHRPFWNVLYSAFGRPSTACLGLSDNTIGGTECPYWDFPYSAYDGRHQFSKNCPWTYLGLGSSACTQSCKNHTNICIAFWRYTCNRKLAVETLIKYLFITYKWPFEILVFLAHLSTKCSRWAFVMAQCPSSIVRASVSASIISLNNFSSETAHWISTKLHRNDP